VIVDGPITYDLTVGADRRITESGDAQTVVPPTVLPAALVLKPTQFILQPANPTVRDSTQIEFQISRNNQGNATSNVITLAPGIWELELSLSTQFDFVGGVGLMNGTSIKLTDAAATTIRIMERVANVGTFLDYVRYRILVRQAVNVLLFVGATAVAEHMDVRLMGNFIRIL